MLYGSTNVATNCMGSTNVATNFSSEAKSPLVAPDGWILGHMALSSLQGKLGK